MRKIVFWLGLMAGGVALAGADVPALWKIQPIQDKTLWANYSCGGWMKDLRHAPEIPMLRDVMLETPWLRMQACRLCLWGSKDYAHFRKPEEMWQKGYPINFKDVVDGWWLGDRQVLEAFERDRPGSPFFMRLMGDGREPIVLEEKYDLDLASFAKWKREHPGFIGFYQFDEVDQDLRSYRNVLSDKKRLEPEVRKWFEANFPLTGKLPEDIPFWLAKSMPRVKARCFGEDRIFGLYSIGLLTGHTLGNIGCKQLWYEAELGSTSSPWRFGGMFVRGAGRQFGVPWCWYMATLVEGQQTRDGKGVWKGATSFTEWPSPFFPKAVPFKGCARSLMARNIMYGYFAGATILRQEKAWEFLAAYASDGSATLSPYGQDFNAPFAFNDAHDRGVPYTPVALLVSISESQHRQHYSWGNKDLFSMPAFLQTLVPTYEKDPGLFRDSKKGDQGCLWNSEFGEIADVLCPDIPRGGTNRFAELLPAYKCVFLVGAFEKEKVDTAALVDFVKGGGELVVEKRHVAAGLVPTEIPHAKGRLIVVDEYLPDYFRTSKDSWFPTKMAKLTSCETTCPVIHDLLKKAQDDYMPVTVEGDIQWGVNKTNRGWLVWLINNKGSEKYIFEPERIDPKAIAHVKITYKATGKFYEKDVNPAGWSFVEICK